MSNIHPFRGVRPANHRAGEVIAPPYDVLSETEARAIVAEKPNSFLRVTRSEVDLPEGSDSHSVESYQQAAVNLREFINNGNMIQDESACFYLYTQTWQGRTQRGLMALCDTAEYDENLIRKHELTRPDKEQDRTDHIQLLGAQTGLVFLTYRSGTESIDTAMAAAANVAPAWTVETDDSVVHSLSVIDSPELIETLQAAFAHADALYIADGHHRSAAASRVAKLRERAGTSGLFLTGIFPDNELQVMAYNRVVNDLNGLDADQFMAAVGLDFQISETDTALPPARGQFTMYIDGTWFLLSPRQGIVAEDVVGGLDVSVLQERILAPLLGIDNPRTNQRITFVGGIRGAQELERAVDGGAAAAFHMFPTGIDQLLDVADANRLMPPKSTWFEPKLRGGVLVHLLDQ